MSEKNDKTPYYLRCGDSRLYMKQENILHIKKYSKSSVKDE